jgi:Protein of unknown function (DUF3455)
MPLASLNRTGTIPELLVKAIKNRGQGLFGQVDDIQRLDTLGGLAPAGSCTNGTGRATFTSIPDSSSVTDAGINNKGQIAGFFTPTSGAPSGVQTEGFVTTQASPA